VNLAQAMLMFGVRVYQWTLSPAKRALLGPAAGCRFSPCCSEYALQSIRNHGAWHGLGLTLRRLVRCHPWGGSGLDPVPRPQPRRRAGVAASQRGAAGPGLAAHGHPLS
jgi:hypothetical protein